jgi:hypothetical protein
MPSLAREPVKLASRAGTPSLRRDSQTTRLHRATVVAPAISSSKYSMDGPSLTVTESWLSTVVFAGLPTGTWNHLFLGTAESPHRAQRSTAALSGADFFALSMLQRQKRLALRCRSPRTRKSVTSRTLPLIRLLLSCRLFVRLPFRLLACTLLRFASVVALPRHRGAGFCSRDSSPACPSGSFFRVASSQEHLQAATAGS